MSERSRAPDVAALEIPIDRWSEGFWTAAAAGELRVPRCAACGRHRWPPGPFCPQCRSQEIEWVDAGQGRVYSFTALREADPSRADGGIRLRIPALVEFPQAGGVRLLAAIIDAMIEEVRIGAALDTLWVQAANAIVPAFRLSRSGDAR